jgi:predicted tellurium resistance membrane protein TerC
LDQPTDTDNNRNCLRNRQHYFHGGTHQQQKARKLGLGLAVITRLGLLLTVSWLAGLNKTWLWIGGHDFSGRDLILIGGGLFLLAKSANEIHQMAEGGPQDQPFASSPRASFRATILQILILDIVFSLDSVITAVGMTTRVGVMMTAVVLAVLVMLQAAQPIADFVERNPSIKMLALSFLLLIGLSLLTEGFEHHIPKGYIYFSMAFSAFVEAMNLRTKARSLAERNCEASSD